MSVELEDSNYLGSILKEYRSGKVGLTYGGSDGANAHILVAPGLVVRIWYERRDGYLDARLFSLERFTQMKNSSNAFERLKIFDQSIALWQMSTELEKLLVDLDFDKSFDCTARIYRALQAFEGIAQEFESDIPQGSEWKAPDIYEKRE